LKICILVFEGVDELDFVGPLEVFRRAGRLMDGIEVRLVTLEEQATRQPVTAAYGLRVLPDCSLGDCDLMVIPGGGWAGRAARGIRYEIGHSPLTQRLVELHARGVTLAAVCTGAMALAAAGLLQSRVAVTHHAALNDLRSAGASVVAARVVDDGDIVTCGGVTSSIDLALHLVERFWGATIAAQIATGMEYTRSTEIR
jgi:transcriptional regulator GlxA family with amidase domain